MSMLSSLSTCLTDAVVTMMHTTRAVTESIDGSAVDVCVMSGIAGNIERDLVVTLTTDYGNASMSIVK